jgi:hypothetical protein
MILYPVGHKDWLELPGLDSPRVGQLLKINQITYTVIERIGASMFLDRPLEEPICIGDTWEDCGDAKPKIWFPDGVVEDYDQEIERIRNE